MLADFFAFSMAMVFFRVSRASSEPWLGSFGFGLVLATLSLAFCFTDLPLASTISVLTLVRFLVKDPKFHKPREADLPGPRGAGFAIAESIFVGELVDALWFWKMSYEKGSSVEESCWVLDPYEMDWEV